MKKLTLYICILFFLFAKTNAQTWVQRVDFAGPGRYDAVGFSIGTKGYLGLGINESLSEFADFWEWDQASNTWTQIANFPGTARDGAAGFSIGKKGYVVTGDTSKELWEWDGDTTSPNYNTWKRKANFPGTVRTAAVAFSIGKKGYIGTGNYTQDLWEWDGDTASPTYNTWTRKADFGGGYRGWATGFSIGKKGYIGTGTDGSYYKKDFWEWDADTASATYNTWSRKADVPGGARIDAVGFSIGNNGYIAMGLDSDGFTNLQDFWQWNPSNNSWVQKLDYAGATRQSTVGFSIENKGYIGTGSNNNATGIKDFWEYCDTLCSDGINELSNALNIFVFPNPASDVIEVNALQETVSSIEIYNLLGEKVYTESNNKQQTIIKIDVSNIPKGVYILKITINNNLLNKKIIIE